MPFTLAHPAAALAFRRWCPVYFSFAAIVVGSLVPDLGNCLNLDNFNHSAIGSVAFCLPVGVVSLWVFYRIRVPLLVTLPMPHRQALLRACRTAHASFFISLISLFLGIWTHLAWDIFTHQQSWLSLHIGSLSVHLFSIGIYQLRASSLVWLISTLVGMALLSVQYALFLKSAKHHFFKFSWGEWRAYVFWLFMLSIPMLISAGLTDFLYISKGYYGSGWIFRAFCELYFTSFYVMLGLVGLLLVFRAGIRDRKPI